MVVAGINEEVVVESAGPPVQEAKIESAAAATLTKIDGRTRPPNPVDSRRGSKWLLPSPDKHGSQTQACVLERQSSTKSMATLEFRPRPLGLGLSGECQKPSNDTNRTTAVIAPIWTGTLSAECQEPCHPSAGLTVTIPPTSSWWSAVPRGHTRSRPDGRDQKCDRHPIKNLRGAHQRVSAVFLQLWGVQQANLGEQLEFHSGDMPVPPRDRQRADIPKRGATGRFCA